MGTRLGYIWQRLRQSYWFVPSLMTLAAVGLVGIGDALNTGLEFEFVEGRWWLWAGGPAGARAMLSTIAGSMITVAGVVFSVTIVALTLASQQYGPRVLRNFLRDTSTQIVLGTFLATFVYCLLALRTVSGVDDAEHVPYVSVTFGVVLALLSVGVLIHFIHHLSSSLQAENLIARVQRELEQTIARLYPQKLGQEPVDDSAAEAQVPPDLAAGARPITTRESGYIEGVEEETLIACAEEADLIVALTARPGEFVVAGETLALAWPARRCDEERHGKLAGAFLLGSGRTLTQDPGAPAMQLVEIALRALSPSLNDPYTASACIDWLRAAFCDLAQREIPSRYRLGERGALRAIADPPTLVHLAKEVFHPLRQAARPHVGVTVRLLVALAGIGACASRSEDRAALRLHADLILGDARDSQRNEHDLRLLEEHHARVLRTLAGPGLGE